MWRGMSRKGRWRKWFRPVWAHLGRKFKLPNRGEMNKRRTRAAVDSNKSCPAKGSVETQRNNENKNFILIAISSYSVHPPSLSRSFVLSASWDVFGFVASLEASVGGVETLLVGSEQSPAGSLGCVVQGWKAPLSSALLVKLDQLLETLVVDPCPPLAVRLELKAHTEVTHERAAAFMDLHVETCRLREADCLNLNSSAMNQRKMFNNPLSIISALIIKWCFSEPIRTRLCQC